jgi:hypothetical protein
LDRINSFKKVQPSLFKQDNKTNSLDSSSKDSKSIIDDVKNSASSAANLINQQRTNNNKVHYDFSHFNDDDSSIKGVRFLA